MTVFFLIVYRTEFQLTLSVKTNGNCDTICNSFKNFQCDSFHVSKNIIAVTVFSLIVYRAEFRLVHNQIENCNYVHIPFQFKGNLKYIYRSVQRWRTRKDFFLRRMVQLRAPLNLTVPHRGDVQGVSGRPLVELPWFREMPVSRTAVLKIESERGVKPPRESDKFRHPTCGPINCPSWNPS